MGLLHHNEDDDGFAAGNAQAGWNKAVRRCNRLRELLEKARSTVTDPKLAAEVDAALAKSFYDESEEYPTGMLSKT